MFGLLFIFKSKIPARRPAFKGRSECFRTFSILRATASLLAALTFDELHEKTSRRGVTEEVHAGDVMELVRRGWAEESSGVIQITSSGKQVRAEVEAETERLFFAPWSSLNESELEELASLAGQLRDGLKNLEGK